MRKRLLSCALAVCLVLGLFAPLEGLTLRAEAVTASKVPAPWLDDFLVPVTKETKAPSGYTAIWDVDDLLAVSDNPDDNYILMADIDLYDVEWTPLCEDDSFTGTFDGNGYVIENLEGPNGLFCNAEEATIKDVGVKYADIDAEFTDQSFGTIGGIVADAQRGTSIQNCFFDGNIDSNARTIGGICGNYATSEPLKNCWMEGDIVSTNLGSAYNEPRVGGIIGVGANNKDALITGCIHNGTIDTMGYAVDSGGIAGLVGGTISYCENYGELLQRGNSADMGGITTGMWDITVEYCMNAADITEVYERTLHGRTMAGGLTCWQADLRNSFNCGNLSLDDATYVGGLSAQGWAENCYNVGSVEVKNFQSDSIGYGYWGAGALFGTAVGDSKNLYYTNTEVPAYDKDETTGDQLENITRLTDSQARSQSSYKGFDFDSVWEMGGGNYPYPVLRDAPQSQDPHWEDQLTVSVPEEVRVHYERHGTDRVGRIDFTTHAYIEGFLSFVQLPIEGPVTYTITLTGGFSFSPGSYKQELTLVWDEGTAIWPKDTQVQTPIYILDQKTGTIQVSASAEGYTTGQCKPYCPAMQFLEPVEDTWALVNSVNSFGYGLLSDYEIPKERYQEVWGDREGALKYAAEHRKWGGNCGGMAWTAGLIVTGGLGLPYGCTGLVNHQGDHLNYVLGDGSYVAVDKDSSITKFIERYQLFQSELMYTFQKSGEEVKKEMLAEYITENSDGTYSHRTNGKYIESLCEQIENSTQPLVATIAYSGGAHTVLLYSNELEEMEDGWYRTPIYNPNNPYLDEDRYEANDWNSAYDTPDCYLELNPEKNLFRVYVAGNADTKKRVAGSYADRDELILNGKELPDRIILFNTMGLKMTEIDPDQLTLIKSKKVDSKPKIYVPNISDIRLASVSGQVLLEIEDGEITQRAQGVSATIEPDSGGMTITLPESAGLSVTASGRYSVDNGDHMTIIDGTAHTAKLDLDDYQVSLTASQSGEVEVILSNRGETDADLQAVKIAGSLDSGKTVTFQLSDDNQLTTQNSQNLEDAEVSVLEEDFVQQPADLSQPVDITAEFEPLPFTDVGTGEWFYQHVRYVFENQLMNGTGDTTFSPNSTLNRAQAAQILYNLEGQPGFSGFSDFDDVPFVHWGWNAIGWAHKNGVVSGKGNGKFAPDDPVSREEFAQMLYNYAKYKGYDLTAQGDLSQFPDKRAVSSWATTAMSWANGNGLINGSDGKLLPGGTTTRAQAASILRNFHQNFVL